MQGVRIKNIVRFVAVPAGGMVALPHLLKWPEPHPDQIPDVLSVSAPGFSVAADDTDVTVVNNNVVVASVDVLVELWHTFERAFGLDATLGLVPRPFVVSPDGGVSGDDLMYLPDVWERINIAANLLNDVVASGASQFFDEVTVNRPLSILGIRTRLTTPITAGDLAVKVSVNGAPIAAFVSHSAGVNPSGGGAVFAPGAFTVVAGDRVGVMMTTSGAFLPITAGVSVWLEAEDRSMTAIDRRAGTEQVRIVEVAAAPAAIASLVLIYSIDVAGVNQLFARTEDGTITQLTPGAGDRSYLPEAWQQIDVPATQAATALACGVSQAFDNFQVMRAGWLTGINLRADAVLTAGDMTAVVTINGVASALSVVLASPNSSNRAFAAFGAIALAAGDLLGITLATAAGLLPAGSLNVDAQIEAFFPL